MKIQKYRVNPDRYTGLYIPDKEDSRFLDELRRNYLMRGKSIAEVWRPIVLLKSVPAMDSDFGHVNVVNAVVNHAAKQVIEALPGDKSQFFPFVSDEEQYHLLVAETIDCLDHERSDHTIYYEDDDAEKPIDIIKIYKPAFKENLLQGKYLFRVPYANETYFTEQFAEVCQRHGLVGLDIDI